MKYFALMLSLWAANAVAASEIIGSWPQPQQLDAVTKNAAQWQFRAGEQTLTLTAPPTAMSQPQAGAWLEMQIRHHPAGMMQKLLWSTSEHGAPCLIFAQNISAKGEALPGGWLWEAGPSLVRGSQRIKLKVGRVTKLKGWSVLLTEVRPAQSAQAGVAYESETRFDWWAQNAACWRSL